MPNQQLLGIKDVVSRTTLSRSTIYNKMKAGTFPRSRRISNQSIAWLESEIDEWIESQPETNPNDWHSPNRQ